MQKKNMQYRFIVPIGIHDVYSLYKLAHGAEHLHCNALFAFFAIRYFACFSTNNYAKVEVS
jgi:hypothetical protein